MRYRYRYIDIDDISMIFSIYRPRPPLVMMMMMTDVTVGILLSAVRWMCYDRGWRSFLHPPGTASGSRGAPRVECRPFRRRLWRSSPGRYWRSSQDLRPADVLSGSVLKATPLLRYRMFCSVSLNLASASASTLRFSPRPRLQVFGLVQYICCFYKD